METPPPDSEVPIGESPDGTDADPRYLFASLYGDLRRLAERQLRRNNGGSLSPTTLLHEAYLDMSGREARFADRGPFMAYAARVMRGLIIDFARERRALKRGSGFEITQMPTELAAETPNEAGLAQLADAIDALGTRDPRLATIVDLKYFCGYSFEEIAVLQGVSVRTVSRDWEKARTLLYQQLSGEL
jgi:RNA polymerase sigma factor (TIGR02999 family)